MIPRSSMTIMASGMVSRMDFIWASRATASSALAAAARRERRNKSPRQEAPTPTSAKTAALTMSRARKRAIVSDEEQAKQQAQTGGEYSRSPPAERRGQEDRRKKEQVRGLADQHGGQHDACGQRDGDGDDGNAVLFHDLAGGGVRRRLVGERAGLWAGFCHRSADDRRECWP